MKFDRLKKRNPGRYSIKYVLREHSTAVLIRTATVSDQILENHK